MTLDLLNWTYLPSQEKFHNSAKRYRLFSGSVGAGKTISLCRDGVLQSYMFPGNFGLIGAQTVPALRDTVIKTFWEGVPKDIIKNYNKTENEVTFKGCNSTIIFRSLDEMGKLKSLNLGWFGIDEITETKEDCFKMLQTRLRRANTRRCGAAATNPDTPEHWVYKRFYETNRHSYDCIEANTLENFHLPEDYIRDLQESFTGAFYERYILGKWVYAGEGCIYEEFHPERHIKKEGEIAKLIASGYIHELIMGLDFGYEHPMGIVLIGKGQDGEYYIIDEIKKRKQVFDKQYVQGELRKFARTAQTCICDSARPDLINLAIDCGLKIDFVGSSKGKDSVIKGIFLINKLFKQNRLFLSDKCMEFRREVQTYSWKKDAQGNVKKEEPNKIFDDLLDAARYAVRWDYLSNPIYEAGENIVMGRR